MIIAKMYLDNVYAFKDFDISFVYPKKLVNAPLDGEYLQDYPNFRYKKLNIIIGSNATGKTSLGRTILHMCLFLKTKESKPLFDLVCDKTKQSRIVFDYVLKTDDYYLNRADVIIDKVEEKEEQKILMRFYSTKLQKNDSYETAAARFDNDVQYKDYLECLTDVEFGSYNFSFPLTEENYDYIHCQFEKEDQEEFRQVLLPVLSTLDPSIKDVIVSSEVDDTYIIVPENGEKFYVSNNAKISSIERLSSGTKYGFNIAATLFAMKKHLNGFYYIDEQFSYTNSEIEIAILNLMVSYLGDGEQLFFTSHNVELLSLNYPNHTFTFLKKVAVNNKNIIEEVNAASLEKRNNVNIKNLYDNDFFGVHPNLEKIYELGEN